MAEQSGSQASDHLPPEVKLNQLITGTAATHMVSAAAKLGLADLLEGGPKSSNELAEAIGAHPRAIYRLLRGLTILGVFAEVQPGHFGLTPLAELLRSDVNGSMRWWAVAFGEEWMTSGWSGILHSVNTNKSAFVHRHGMSTFEYFDKNPDAAESFNNAMSSLSGQEAAAVIAAYDFEGVRKLVDVGGGRGLLISAILEANPDMRGVLFDQPSVIEGASLASKDITNRCEAVSGDFFQSVPSGGDAYVLKSIIHDWSDERAANILHNIRSAITEDGKLLLIERDLPESGEPSVGKIFDVIMLVFEDGFERTEVEYSSLLKSTGFELTRVLRTQSPMNIFEAVPI